MNSKLRVIVFFSTIAVIYPSLGKCEEGNVPKHPSQVNLFALAQELQKGVLEANRQVTVMWMPKEFFDASGAQDPSVTPEEHQELLNLIDRFTIVAIRDSTIQSDGNQEYLDEAHVQRSTRLVGPDGQNAYPINHRELNSDMRRLVATLGDGFVLLVFPAYDSKGNRIADPTGDGKMTVVYEQQTFKWRLPIEALIED